jgi:2-haloacid dehalogenase
MNRRHFVGLALAGAGATMLPAAAAPTRIRALAIDGLALFDPRPVFALAEVEFPNKGAILAAAWRTRIFEYTWLRTLTGNYVDFMQVIQNALVFACKQEKLELTADKQRRLLNAFLELKAWPDVVPVLKQLRERGIRLAPLANFSLPMIDNAIKNSGLDGVFDHRLSTDRIQMYKPAPRAYQMGVDAFGLKKEEIGFVAFASWDAYGAAAFGYPTLWINRMNQPAEEIGAPLIVQGTTFSDVLAFVAGAQAS